MSDKTSIKEAVFSKKQKHLRHIRLAKIFDELLTDDTPIVFSNELSSTSVELLSLESHSANLKLKDKLEN